MITSEFPLIPSQTNSKNMPELAELRLSSDSINTTTRGKVFTHIKKNPEHKGLDIEKPYDNFTIESLSRGKELLLILQDTKTNRETSLKFTFGMAGHFKFTKTGEERKHSHLMFYTNDGYTLSFVDVRRFGKWKWEGWGKDRGPDPTKDYKNFVKKIEENLHQKAFDRPIGEALLNQAYFNGIGNYLRAEILYKTNQNPFEPAREAIKNNPKILAYCNTIPTEAIILGGGQIKQWENPFGVEPDMFQKWMICYGNKNMKQTIDGTGRRLWYDPKWKRNED